MYKFRKYSSMNKNYMKSALVTLMLGVSFALYAQPANVAINPAGASSANPAILDLSDASNANLGFLIPNVSLLSTTDNTTVVSAATGLLVWNTNAAMVGGLGVGFYYWSGTTWLYIMNSGAGSAITGVGIAGYDGRWTSGTAIGTGVTQDNGTGVSISSTVLAPVNKLDVKGNAAFGSYAGTAAPANGLIVSGQVGIGTSAPNASAALDVTSSTQGLLPPRVANPATIVTPAAGLVVLNSTTGCIQFYNGVSWQNISCPCAVTAPGAVTGNTGPLISTSATYTCGTVAGATSYNWSVSTTNGVVTAGQGTTSATITFSGTAGVMNICATATVGFCTSAPTCLTVTSSSCNPVVVLDAISGAAPIQIAGSTSTINITTTAANEIVVVGAEGDPFGSAINCTVTYTGPSSGTATFMNSATGMYGGTAVFAFAAPTAGAYSIIIAEGNYSTTYSMNFAASFKGFCSPATVAGNVVNGATTNYPTGTGLPSQSTSVTTSIANSVIFTSYGDANGGGSAETWTGATILGSPGYLFISGGEDGSNSYTSCPIPATYVPTVSITGGSYIDYAGLVSVIIHP